MQTSACFLTPQEENIIKNLNMRRRNKIGDLDHDQAVKEQQKIIKKKGGECHT